MAASTNAGQWELVVKGSKKTKNVSVTNGKLNKTEKRQFGENAPKLTVIGTVESGTNNTNATTNGVVGGKENREPKSPKRQSSEHKKKKKDKKEEAQKQPRTLIEAITKLNIAEMEKLIDMVGTRFQDSPLIWLKDLTSYFNVKLNPIQQQDPAFREDAADYPLSQLAPDVKKLIVDLLVRCNDSVLSTFHQHCITSMLHETAKGLSVYGYKLFLQLLASHKPTICLTHLGSYSQLRHNYQSQPSAILSLLWALGQAGKRNFSVALKVWLDLMVPVIGLKNYSAYVVEYGANVFADKAVPDQDFSEIFGVREFFSIFDITWGSSISLPKHLQRQLFTLYPKIKTVAMNCRSKVQHHVFFPSFLCRLDNTSSAQLNEELLSSLTQCLSHDVQCWSVWNQLYLKHLPQSAMLLAHLRSQWGVLGKSAKLNKTEVKDTMEKIVATNQKMEHKVHAVAGLKEATVAAKGLLQQMSGNKKGPWLGLGRTSKFLILLLLLAISWDIRKAGSFNKSTIGRTLDNLGLTVYLESIGSSIRRLSINTYKWCNTNLPVYYSRSCDLVGPYLILVWDKVTIMITVIYDAIINLLGIIKYYIPIIKDKLEMTFPGIGDSASNLWTRALEVMMASYVVVREFLQPYLDLIYNFMFTKVLTGPLEPQKLFGYVTYVGNYTAEAAIRLHTQVLIFLNENVTLSSRS